MRYFYDKIDGACADRTAELYTKDCEAAYYDTARSCGQGTLYESIFLNKTLNHYKSRIESAVLNKNQEAALLVAMVKVVNPSRKVVIKAERELVMTRYMATHDNFALLIYEFIMCSYIDGFLAGH